MVQILMILLFGSIYIHDGMEDAAHAVSLHPAQNPIRIAGITLAGFYAIWGTFHLLAVWCGSQVDKTGRLRWVRTAEMGMTIARLAAAAWWAFALFELDWLKAVRTMVGDGLLYDELLAMSPFIALLAGAWWSIYPVERRLQDAMLMRQLDDPEGHGIYPPVERMPQVWMSIRHQVLLWMVPLTIIMGWRELLGFVGDPLVEFLNRVAPGGSAILILVLDWTGMLVIVITTPVLMRIVWDTVAIGPGPLADQVHAMCRKYGVRVGGPLLWRTRGTMVNGAILGVFWPFRFMLLTDALLERLSPAQVEAVMAHEVAHVRRRHLIWLAVCVISTAIVVTLAIAAAAGALQTVMGNDANGDWISIMITVVSLGGAGFVFGMVSRRFEWQADAFAVQHLSMSEKLTPVQAVETQIDGSGFPSLTSSLPSTASPSVPPRVTRAAVVVMSSALQAVADLNGIAANQFSWRHGSIRQRQENLLSLVDVPVAAAPIDKQVRIIKVVAAVALVLGIASMVVEEILHASH